MMSVFCSITLIFATECWTCILRGPGFKIFPETHAFATIFFRLQILQSFWHLLKILLKPCDSPDLNSLKLRGRRTERSFKAIIEKKAYEKVSANIM